MDLMPDYTEMKLREGDIAPDFTATTNGGEIVTLSDFKGRNVLLYFYPKDNTPGCTTQACAIRDNWSEFESRGVVVFGVNTDSVKSHDRFVEKRRLPFKLIADEDKKIVRAYTVWGPKKFFGIKYNGTSRATFLIGPDGRIKKIWPRVNPSEHVAQVLAAL